MDGEGKTTSSACHVDKRSKSSGRYSAQASPDTVVRLDLQH